MPVVLCIIGILTQQRIVALTTIAIAHAAGDVSACIDPTHSLIVFCVLLASVSIPEMLIEFGKEWSKYWFLNKAVSHAATSNYGATGAFFNKRIKTEKESHALRLHGEPLFCNTKVHLKFMDWKLPLLWRLEHVLISQEKTPRSGRRSALRSLEAGSPPSQQW